ncbi:MAG: PEP-CTERM sorting domain-containing protein, partial [Planctomycetales bacterium]|nr:PEP-CTERM sorting domain-containing protein [Planctomycetales bacterium]
VSTVLTLDAASPVANTFDLALADGFDQSTISGTMNADIDIDFLTGAISSINLTGGSLVASGWSMNVTGIGPLNATPSDATADTIPVLSLVSGTSFDATEHRIQLLNGTVNPVGVGLGGTNIEGSGTGSLTSTLNGGQYDIVFSMDVNDTEVFPPGVNLTIMGTVVARGSITAIPEPTAAIALCAMVAGLGMRRRRR